MSASPSSLLGSFVRGVVPALAAMCALGLSVSAGSAAAQGSGYSVTYVARNCPEFTDIFANRARNDIMESLEDLGPNTQYTQSNFQVNPVAESMPRQDKCTDIPNWQFTLGTGYESRAVTGPWGALSRVTNPYDTVINTQPSTPLLNQNGDQVGHQTIAGAVTVELTDEQARQASHTSSLWAQGGTPSDPVLVGRFPGPKFAFGALRCAVDALNGDNVEFIYFPSGVKHVFCYALYVSPPPTAGLITIKKQVSGAPAGDETNFAFNGSLSFNPAGFTLGDGQSLDFVRAGGETWDVTETAVDNFSLTSVNCSATAQGGGTPTSTWTPGATTTINLVAGEHVTCVYNNAYVPPGSGLTIRKTTIGGTGSFGYRVSPAGGGEEVRASATTTVPGVPVDTTPSLLSLAPGTYTIRERRPSSPDGRWRLVRVRCNGEAVTSRPAQVEVRSGEGSICTFVNRFIPRGSISLAKVTYGGTGTASFLVNGPGPMPARFIQHATTTLEGVAADAEPATSADATDHLRLGSYTIVEQPPTTAQAGQWALATVVCNGVVQPFAQGAVTVRLTQQQPSIHCQFTNVFTANPPPDPPPVVPPVNPPGGGGSTDPSFPVTDLAVTKQAFPSTVVAGHVVTYRITVRNISHVTAQHVFGFDQNVVRGRILSIHTTAGTCRIRPRGACSVRNLKPGGKVVVTARLIPPIVGRFVNTVAVGSATRETNLANNRARATIRVLPPPHPPVAVTGSAGGLG